MYSTSACMKSFETPSRYLRETIRHEWRIEINSSVYDAHIDAVIFSVTCGCCSILLVSSCSLDVRSRGVNTRKSRTN